MAIQNTLEGASPESRGVYRLKSIILVHLYNLLFLLLILPYIPPFATHLVAVVQFSSVQCDEENILIDRINFRILKFVYDIFTF